MDYKKIKSRGQERSKVPSMKPLSMEALQALPLVNKLGKGKRNMEKQMRRGLPYFNKIHLPGRIKL